MNTINRYFPCLTAIALFFCFHHYGGIILDAILYLLQYVHSVSPERFLGDPPFDFGNQDSFGFFSPLLGAFVKSLGVDVGMKTMCALSHLGWCIAVILLINSITRFFKNEKYFLFILFCFIFATAPGMPHTKIHFFRLVETYTCSRQFSLDLGIVALSMIFFGKKWASLILALVGTVIHPLTAGWTIPIWIFFFYPKMRTPVIVGALLIPFSAFIHYGKFDFLPSNWLGRPLAFAPTKSWILRDFSCLLFLGVVFKKYALDDRVSRLLQSLCYTILIAFYWNVWGGWGDHIFFYQVQPWRAEWLLSVVCLPIYTILFVNEFRIFSQNKTVSTKTFSVLLMGLSLLLPETLFTLMLLAVYNALCKVRKISSNYFLGVFVYFISIGFIIQQYIIFCLEGNPAVLGFDYQWLYHLRDTLFLGQFIFAVGFAIYWIKQKKYVLSALLVVFCIFPMYQLIPILAIALTLFPLKGVRNVLLFISLFLIVVFDCLFNTSLRQESLFGGLPSVFFWGTSLFFSIFGLFLIVMLSLLCSSVLQKRGRIKIAMVPTFFSLFICTIVAWASYDQRSIIQQQYEKRLNDFLSQPIFPDIKNFGKVFFLVEGYYCFDARLQFLSGAYLSASTHVGEIFFKEHYLEAQKRDNLMLYNENRLVVTGETTYGGLVERMLIDESYRSDRLRFLCEVGEIENIVSSIQLPFNMLDAKEIYDGQTIYLYSCND